MAFFATMRLRSKLRQEANEEDRKQKGNAQNKAISHRVESPTADLRLQKYRMKKAKVLPTMGAVFRKEASPPFPPLRPSAERSRSSASHFVARNPAALTSPFSGRLKAIQK